MAPASEDISSGVSLSRVEELMALVMPVSKRWAAAIAIAAVVSTLHVNLNDKSNLSGSVGISSLTAVLLGLIWLPSLLRVLGVAGVRVKTPAGEATTPGLATLFETVDPETKRETLPVVLTALTSPGVLADPAERRESRALRRDLELQLAAVTPLSGDVRQTLLGYASEYEGIRRQMAAAPERTRRMTHLTAEVRAVARGMPSIATDLRRMLEEGNDGERIVALAVAQDQPDRSLFDGICDAITNSHSAFEQYHALVAALEMLSLMDRAQRSTLARVLRHALDDPVRAIGDDTSRARIVEALLGAVGGPKVPV